MLLLKHLKRSGSFFVILFLCLSPTSCRKAPEAAPYIVPVQVVDVVQPVELPVLVTATAVRVTVTEQKQVIQKVQDANQEVQEIQRVVKQQRKVALGKLAVKRNWKAKPKKQDQMYREWQQMQ